MKRDYSELRKRIRSIYPRLADFAKDMGMTPSTLSLKLTGRSEWTRVEIEKVRRLLGLTVEELLFYFF